VLWSNVGLIVYTADPEDQFTPLSVSALHGLYTDLTGPYPRGLLRPFLGRPRTWRCRLP
jgi:hypothetical protein